jgi:hypothetical protein
MARLLRVTLHEQNKREHIRVLVPFLFTAKAVRIGWEKLGRREREAMAAIQRAGGDVSTGRLKQQLVRQRVIQLQEKQKYYSSYASTNIFLSERNRTDFKHIIGRLIASGLVCGRGVVNSNYSTRTKIYYDNPKTVYIPQKIQHLLPEPPPLDVQHFELKNLSRIDKSSARTFQRDLYLYWSTVRAEPLKLTNEQRLYQKDLRRVNAALQQPEALGRKDELGLPRMIFMRRLMASIGILQQKAKSVTALEHPKFLSQNPTTRVQRTFEQWRDGHFWNEVLSIPNIRPYNIGTRLDDVPEQISQARKIVLDHVIALHQEGWVSLEMLVDSMRIGDYDCLLPRDDKPK